MAVAFCSVAPSRALYMAPLLWLLPAALAVALLGGATAAGPALAPAAVLAAGSAALAGCSTVSAAAKAVSAAEEGAVPLVRVELTRLVFGVAQVVSFPTLTSDTTAT